MNANDPAVLAVIVNLAALVVHAGLGFYWAGRIVGRLALIDDRVARLSADHRTLREADAELGERLRSLELRA